MDLDKPGPVPAVPPISWVTVGPALRFSVPLFVPLFRGDDNNCSVEMIIITCWGEYED